MCASWPMITCCDWMAWRRCWYRATCLAASRARLREVYRCLQRDQAVIIFPAGEVSRIHANGIRDARWSEGFLRIARKTSAPVLPIHIGARNSPAFYGVSLLAKPLGTLFLARSEEHTSELQSLMRISYAVF